MAPFGLDYGDPIGHAIGAYTALKSSDLQQQEFAHRKAIDDQTMQIHQDAHDQATTTFNNAQKANQVAGIQAELRNSNGAPSQELLDRAFAVDPSLKQYLDPKFSSQRKAEIDKAMTAFGDLTAQQQPAQQQAIANPIQGADGPMSPLPQLAPAQTAMPAAQPQAVNADVQPQAYDPTKSFGDNDVPPGTSPLQPSAIVPTGESAQPASPSASSSADYPSQVVAKNQLLNSMTDIFRDRLMAGKLDDGNPPKDAQIIDVHPSPDGKAVALEVQFTRKDGSTYNAPITENRTADPNDPVKFIPVASFVDRMATERALISGLDAARAKYGDKEVISRMDALTQATATQKAYIARMQPYIDQQEAYAKQLETQGDIKGANAVRGLIASVKSGEPAKDAMELAKFNPRADKYLAGKNGTFLDTANGAIIGADNSVKQNTNVMRAPIGAIDLSGNPIKQGTPVYMNNSGGKISYSPAVLTDTTGGAASKLPADAQMVEYMVGNGIAPDKKTAYDMVKHTKENPQAMVIKLAHDAIHARDAQFVQPGDKGYKTDQQIIDDAQGLVAKINAGPAPSAITPSPAAPTVQKRATAKIVQQAANNATTKQAAIGILKGLGYTHDETGRPL
jgi:hypothetical protein